jgi:DUF4097 and DUF4098 domain-containing protein YvlB
MQSVAGGDIAGQARFERSLTVTGRVELVIRTGAGHINVSTGESSIVEVRGTIRAREIEFSNGKTAARLAHLRAHPPVEQHDNIIKIGQITDPDLQRNVSISYDLTVPVDSRLTANAGSGSITIEGVAGPVDATTSSGAITAIDVAGDVHARAASGEIEAQSIKGNLRVSTGSGPIHAAGVAGSFHAATACGSVEASDVTGDRGPRVQPPDLPSLRSAEGGEETSPGRGDNGSAKSQAMAGEVQVTTVLGDIHLRNARGHVRARTSCGLIRIKNDEWAGAFSLESVSGDIEVQLPASAGFEVGARTVFGVIDSRRPITIQRSGARGVFAAKSGDGGVQLALTTVSGNIHIR